MNLFLLFSFFLFFVVFACISWNVIFAWLIVLCFVKNRHYIFHLRLARVRENALDKEIWLGWYIIIMNTTTKKMQQEHIELGEKTRMRWFRLGFEMVFFFIHVAFILCGDIVTWFQSRWFKSYFSAEISTQTVGRSESERKVGIDGTKDNKKTSFLHHTNLLQNMNKSPIACNVLCVLDHSLI